MKAAYYNEPGPPEVIQYGDLPDPQCGPGQVLVRVGAVSVNPIDTYIRGGANYWELPKPTIPGCDLAGTVVEVGEGVTQFQVGDRVWGSNQGLLGRQGTFAELCAVDAQWLYPTPEKVSDEEAAAVALVGITAHLGLFRRAHLQPGETIFVRGGTGGVGAMVVQMAKAVGARVLTTAGGDAKAELCRELGADGVIDYTREDVPTAARELAADGVDVFWETLREPDFDFAVDLLKENGRMVLMAGRDARPPLPVGPFYVKCLSLLGFVMFKAPAEEQATCAADINHWLATGKLKAVIDRVLPLSQAAEAHRLQEQHTIHKQSCLRGKIVLKP
ncbi:MAG: NADPH:quinone reductase [Planctomycetota bacterium]|nr:MAG: NADPH:quinone reductase [Planctomycetota bacterium]